MAEAGGLSLPHDLQKKPLEPLSVVNVWIFESAGVETLYILPKRDTLKRMLLLGAAVGAILPIREL